MEPKDKKVAKPTKFGFQQGGFRSSAQHGVIKGRRRETILNAQDLRDEVKQINTRIDSLRAMRIPPLHTIEELQSKRKKLTKLFEKTKQELLQWDDLYQAGGGPNWQPPPPPPPPAGGGGIMV